MSNKSAATAYRLLSLKPHRLIAKHHFGVLYYFVLVNHLCVGSESTQQNLP